MWDLKMSPFMNDRRSVSVWVAAELRQAERSISCSEGKKAEISKEQPSFQKIKEKQTLIHPQKVRVHQRTFRFSSINR